MNKIAISLIVLLGFTLASCKGKGKEAPEMAPSIDVATPIVKTITLTKEYPGYLSSDKTVDLVARVNGTLQTSYLVPGAKVNKGDLIFVIEPTQYKDAVQQAEASLKTAQAQLVYAQSNYERMKEAAKSGAVSQIQVIQAQSDAKQYEASVKNAEAALNTAQTNLSYCYIRAPFNGSVTKATHDVGNYISGATQAVTLATLYKDDLMYVNFNIEDNQYMRMKMVAEMNNKSKTIPDTIMIKVGQEQSKLYKATLDYLSPNVDLSTGTLTLRANLNNPNGELKSGLYVTITLPYGELNDAVLVQDASIGTDQVGKYMYVVNDSNKVSYQHVEIGQLVDDTLRQIVKGVSPKELYVTKALLKVRQGMTIKPVK